MAGPSGGGGIRTHEPLWGFRFSRPARSTAPAPRRVPRWYVCYARVSTPPRRRGAPSSQRASGTAIVPPSSWKFSISAIIVRAVTAVPFSVATCSSFPSRLVVGRVRGRGELAVALLPGEPAFDVVLLHGGCPEVAGGDVDDAVRDVEPADQLLLDLEQPLVLVARGVEGREDEHLHLVELVHAEHPARVHARRARLAPEVRRVARVAQRDRVELEDLAHVHRGETDLRRARQVELVAL